MKKEIKPWKRLDSRLLQKTRVFDLYAHKMRSPDGCYEDDFYVVESKDWVNVIALTPKQEVILVRQFRHGILESCLETPGGIIMGTAEDPGVAGVRELKEETGYIVKGETTSLGYVHPNPAIQDNRCYFYLCTECVNGGPQDLDPAEDISVELVPLSDIPQMIKNEAITHSLCVNAFLRYFLIENKIV